MSKSIKKKSMKLNMVFNALNGMMNVIFPLITFPYISKVLGVEELGKINFSYSVIGYFSLLAGLGISAYGIREGARIRNNKKEMDSFASQLFSINILSCLVSYILFLVIIITVDKFRPYKWILLIYSLQIFFATIGVDWLYTIYEAFSWMTLRKFIIKVVSLVMMLVFVKTPSDTVIYVIITVFAEAGGYIINFILSRKYSDIHFTLDIDFKQHFKPILILFATAISVSIFVNSDTTILGILCGDREVGIYTVATKVYLIVKNILSSVIVAAIPRLSAAINDKDNSKYSIIADDVFKTLITVLLPAMVGIILLRKNIILIMSNETYLDAQVPLFILGFSLIASLVSWFWAQCVLVPMRREKDVLISNIVSAFVNVVLNVILMPIWGASAAAFTTLVSEIICSVWAIIIGIRYYKTKGLKIIVIKVLAGCGAFALLIRILSGFNLSYILFTILSIVISIPLYFVIEILLKNETIYSVFNSIKRVKG